MYPSIVPKTRSSSDKLTSYTSPSQGRFDYAALPWRREETMSHMRRPILGALLLAAMPLFGQAKDAPSQHHRQPQPKMVAAVHPDRGQQVFEQNCSRCHNAPEGFSPQISDTIAMHMRVRAGLSDADYKALLRFLNP
jgi:cytochrome c5